MHVRSRALGGNRADGTQKLCREGAIPALNFYVVPVRLGFAVARKCCTYKEAVVIEAILRLQMQLELAGDGIPVGPLRLPTSIGRGLAWQ